MSSAEKIRRLFAKSDVTVNSKVDDKIVSDALTAFDKSEETRSISAEPNIRRIIMKSRITKLAVAASIVVAVLIGVHYFGVSLDGAGVAWADVLANMEAAQTVMFESESKAQYEDGGYSREKGTTRVKACYRRIDGTGEYLFPGEAPHESPEQVAHVCDLSRNKSVTYHTANKWAYVFVGKEGQFKDSLVTYDGLKKDFRDGTEESLGKVTIDGRDAVCFKISKENKEITVWADPDTALPIRIERTIDDPPGDVTFEKLVLDNITFDVQMDDELFSTTPPDDYVVVNMNTEEFKIPFELTEQHLIEGLSVVAKTLGGKFPTRYKGGRPGKEAQEKAIAEMIGQSEPPMNDKFKPMLGTEFVKRLPESSGWQYVGEDVKLGDAAKAVCWWKPAESDTYRVIYGDLSMRDVETSDLPEVPWPPRRK